MSENFEAILRDGCGLVKDRPIIVGVSGGPDSLCLMEILRQAGYSLIIAHFDHQLRPESSQDARMVEMTAARLILDCIINGADVRAFADHEKLSLEEAARSLRYQFMFKLARKHNAQAVAVGHTADDQVETILMHFLRGSGLAGLKGMPYKSIVKIFDAEIPIVRPLLDMRREETIKFCAANDLSPHYDSSNDSFNFQRNRIRHSLIPELENYNPKFRDAVLRMSETLKGDHAFMLELLETAWHEIMIAVDEGVITLDFNLLSKNSLSLQRNLIKKAMQTLQPDIDVDFLTLERATHLIKDLSTSAVVDLKAGLRLYIENDLIFISKTNSKLPINLWPQLPDGRSIAISIPGQIELMGSWKLYSNYTPLDDLARAEAERNEDPFRVWLDAEQIPDSLELRVRRRGDRFFPLGMQGHSQKISDFFVNEKVPHRVREHWPLLCAGDEIFWVAGYRPSHSCRLTASTRKAFYFYLSNPLKKNR